MLPQRAAPCEDGAGEHADFPRPPLVGEMELKAPEFSLTPSNIRYPGSKSMSLMELILYREPTILSLFRELTFSSSLTTFAANT